MLTMRQVTKATELKRFKELEGEYHYMGETHSGGDTMRLVFEEDGKWVALMVWGSACYHLKPRDAYVGWTNSIRAERLRAFEGQTLMVGFGWWGCAKLWYNPTLPLHFLKRAV